MTDEELEELDDDYELIANDLATLSKVDQLVVALGLCEAVLEPLRDTVVYSAADRCLTEAWTIVRGTASDPTETFNNYLGRASPGSPGTALANAAIRDVNHGHDISISYLGEVYEHLLAWMVEGTTDEADLLPDLPAEFAPWDTPLTFMFRHRVAKTDLDPILDTMKTNAATLERAAAKVEVDKLGLF